MAENKPFFTDYNPDLYLPKNSYTPAHLRATQKYREKNREKYNAYQRKYHVFKMRTDMDYRNRRAEALEKSTKKRLKRLKEAKQAKLEHDAKKLKIVKEKTGIEKNINQTIQIDEL